MDENGRAREAAVDHPWPQEAGYHSRANPHDGPEPNPTPTNSNPDPGASHGDNRPNCDSDAATTDGNAGAGNRHADSDGHSCSVPNYGSELPALGGL